MAPKDEAHTRISNIKADLRSISTCTNATVSALQEILSKKDEETHQKENVKTKAQATARRRAGTAATAAAAAAADVQKQRTYTIAARDKYILATEVANKTLQMLAEALKKAGVPAELRLYDRGGHGYGLRKTKEPVTTWNERCAEWLGDRGLLKK